MEIHLATGAREKKDALYVALTFDSKEEYREIIRLLANEPIASISVSTYGYDKKAFGFDKNMAQLTREVTDLPLVICGGIYDSASGEEALQDANIILSAKSLLLILNWVEDVRINKALDRYRTEENTHGNRRSN